MARLIDSDRDGGLRTCSRCLKQFLAENLAPSGEAGSFGFELPIFSDERQCPECRQRFGSLSDANPTLPEYHPSVTDNRKKDTNYLVKSPTVDELLGRDKPKDDDR